MRIFDIAIICFTMFCTLYGCKENPNPSPSKISEITQNKKCSVPVNCPNDCTDDVDEYVPGQLVIANPEGSEPLSLETIGHVVASQIYIYADSCLLYTSPSPRDRTRSRMPSSA